MNIRNRIFSLSGSGIPDRLLLLMAFLANIVLSLYVFSGLSDAQVNVYFNSDTLYLPSLFRDLFVDRSGFAGWHLNAAPNFFPDMFFFFLLSAFIPDFILAAFIYSILQYTVVLYLFYRIYRILHPGISHYPLSLSLFMMLLFPLTTLLYPNDFIYTFYLYSISYHMGSFVMALLSLLILLSCFKTPSRSRLVILSLVVLASTISDRLYLVQFPIPLLAGLLLWKNRDFMKKYLWPVLITGISVALGLLLFSLIKNNSSLHIISTYSKMFNFTNIAHSFRTFTGQHLGYIVSFDTRGIINMISFSVIVVFLFHSIRFVFGHFIAGGVPGAKLTGRFFDLFFTAFALVVLFAPVINGGYQGTAMLRYNVYALYFSVFALSRLFAIYGPGLRLQTTLAGLNLAIALVVIILMVWYPLNHSMVKGFGNFRDYYPGIVSCTDRFARETGARYGVAEYWNAKRITMFSREGVRVYTVFHDMAIWHHVMNENWYYRGGKGFHGDPDFRFVVMERMDTVAVDTLLGKPVFVYPCGRPDTQIFLFPSFEFNRKTRKPFYPG